jgi:2-polyprenyl-6-hydroxyphenyl methylase/3-demethylubiquinone-9 3-methyltransferase
MQFDFGQNWKEFSENSLSPDKVEQARTHFRALMQDVDLQDKTFLDIGFGQGLSLLIASKEGALVTGMEINPKCAEVVERNKQVLGIEDRIETVVGSVLNAEDLAKLQGRQFDIVHSWGVLHHTGDMQTAIGNACAFVRPGGVLVLAIYNRHWSSLPWLWIKWLYCHLPVVPQKLMIGLFYPIILGAKFLVTGKNPMRMSRGMDFYYNVVDWVGGYPYEYASIDEMKDILARLGFSTIKTVAARVPTGCNEFVCHRTA